MSEWHQVIRRSQSSLHAPASTCCHTDVVTDSVLGRSGNKKQKKTLWMSSFEEDTEIEINLKTVCLDFSVITSP